MWLYLLAFYQDIHTFFHHKWKLFHFWWTGSQRHYLTYDEQVLPYRSSHASIYCPIYKVIYTPEHKHTKRRCLPWLGISIKSKDKQWDISDWISDIRVQSTMPTLLQMVRLASSVHRQFVPEVSETEIHVINRMGEEEVYQYNGKIELTKKDE